MDEAHGAHLGLHAALPPSAMQSGAAVAVQSTHKVLGALTQAAMLHVGSSAPAGLTPRIAARLRMFQTTSPSYLLMTSLEAAAHEAAASEAFEAPLAAAKALRAGAAEAGLRVLGANAVAIGTPLDGHARQHGLDPAVAECDPLRVTCLASDCGLTGHELAAKLQEHGVVVELATSRCIVAALGVGSRVEDGERAAAALRRIAGGWSAAAPSAPHGSPDRVPGLHGREDFARGPERVASCRATLVDVQASLSQPAVRVPLSNAAGRIAAAAVSVYPPGVPALIPGERIEGSKLLELQCAVRQGASLVGCSSDLSDVAVCAGG